MPPQKLGVIGGGPKAAAIATKAACLKELAGIDIEVVVFERDVVGAAWNGQFGYTDGSQRLCTPAERDVGFPYETDIVDELSIEMHRRYSWAAFAIHTGFYADWLDRGRPKPTHKEFAEYLEFCFHDLAPVKNANVTRLSHRKGRWTVHYTDGATGIQAQENGFDGLVVTGPGPQASRLKKIDDQRLFDGVSFWRPGVLGTVIAAAQAAPDEPVVIIGSGGTSAATAAALVRAKVANDIVVLGTQAALYARADSYFENRAFRDPNFWATLSPSDRRVFSDRLTRGAVWSNVVDVLAQVNTVAYLQGSAIEVRIDPPTAPDSVLTVDYTTSANPTTITSRSASVVIDATGFDPTWFRALLSQSLAGQLANESRMRNGMASDLSLPLRRAPPLHAPWLSQAIGPAYNSLMALGSLSDAVLRPYVGAAMT